MAKYTIIQRVDYYAEGIEANSEEEAMELYQKDQDQYYKGVYSESITEYEEEDEDDE